MSVFGKFKKAFGFSDDENDDFYNENEIVESSMAIPHNKVNNQAKASNVEASDLTPQIFDGVIKIINESLPDFLKSCLDVEAQRRYIYDSLDESLKAVINKTMNDAKSTAAVQWQNERENLRVEIEQLKNQAKALNDKHGELYQQYLSAERQKRALKERVTDLENQASNFEAEKEQYQLEVKSLLNKLKVSQVLDGDTAELKSQIVSLQEQLEEARNAEKSNELQQLIDNANAQISEKDQEIGVLKEQITLLNESSQQSDSTQIEALQQHVEQLTEQNTTLESALSQLKQKEEIADAMINDLNKKTAEAIEKLKQAQSEIQSKDEQLLSLTSDNSSSSQEVETLKNMLKLSNEELQAVRDELESQKEEINQAHETLAVLDEIQEQLEKFEEIKEKKDAQIADLKKQTKSYSVQISDLKDENESLKKTIEKNLYSQVESERSLREEIETLKSQLKSNQSIEPVNLDDEIVQEIEASVKRQPKISAIDDSLDDTDWLVATPPPGTVTRPTPSTTDDDFGYKSPVIKQAPQNEAQMSLFE